ncbi:MAG: hypothetical protein K0U66_04960 [Gammaproteobacteria bacterium]|nr:hypothetical protein [Gammaproteobacteria bacterium]
MSSPDQPPSVATQATNSSPTTPTASESLSADLMSAGSPSAGQSAVDTSPPNSQSAKSPTIGSPRPSVTSNSEATNTTTSHKEANGIKSYCNSMIKHIELQLCRSMKDLIHNNGTLNSNLIDVIKKGDNSLRGEMHDSINTLRGDIKKSNKKFRKEIRKDVAESKVSNENFQTEIRKEFAESKVSNKKFRKEIRKEVAESKVSNEKFQKQIFDLIKDFKKDVIGMMKLFVFIVLGTLGLISWNFSPEDNHDARVSRLENLILNNIEFARASTKPNQSPLESVIVPLPEQSVIAPSTQSPLESATRLEPDSLGVDPETQSAKFNERPDGGQ